MCLMSQSPEAPDNETIHQVRYANGMNAKGFSNMYALYQVNGWLSATRTMKPKREDETFLKENKKKVKRNELP